MNLVETYEKFKRWHVLKTEYNLNHKLFLKSIVKSQTEIILLVTTSRCYTGSMEKYCSK